MYQTKTNQARYLIAFQWNGEPCVAPFPEKKLPYVRRNYLADNCPEMDRFEVSRLEEADWFDPPDESFGIARQTVVDQRNHNRVYWFYAKNHAVTYRRRKFRTYFWNNSEQQNRKKKLRERDSGFRREPVSGIRKNWGGKYGRYIHYKQTLSVFCDDQCKEYGVKPYRKRRRLDAYDIEPMEACERSWKQKKVGRQWMKRKEVGSVKSALSPGDTILGNEAA